MRRYWAYLKKLSEHKFYVFLEACKLGIPWLGFIHDWSKLLPSEIVTCARLFYNSDGSPTENHGINNKPESLGPDFEQAWLHHRHWNKHHWEHWILIQDKSPDKPLLMPKRYAKEMLADWRGAGRAYGTNDTKGWYMANGSKMRLHPLTRDC